MSHPPRKGARVRLDHSQIVVDFEGQPLEFPVTTDTSRPMTFRDLAIVALTNPGPDERMRAEDKARCFEVAQKFYRGKTAKLTVDEASFLKERAGIILAQLSYGRLCEWVEGKPQQVATDDEDEDEAVQA